MTRHAKNIALCVALISAVYALAIVGNAYAQASNAKPAIPEFALKYADYSYDVAPVYGIDPNTDDPTVITEGYHVDNRTVQFTIKNQPFTPYVDPANGKTINLFYNIKYKPTDAATWTSMFGGEREFYAGNSDPNFNPYTQYGFPLQNYTSEYTTIKFTYPSNIPTNAQVDFQVQALEGYTECATVGESHLFVAFVNYSFYGEKSGWTGTQTAPLTEPTPSAPEFTVLAILPLLLAVPAVAVVLRQRNSDKRTSTAHN